MATSLNPATIIWRLVNMAQSARERRSAQRKLAAARRANQPVLGGQYRRYSEQAIKQAPKRAEQAAKQAERQRLNPRNEMWAMVQDGPNQVNVVMISGLNSRERSRIGRHWNWVKYLLSPPGGKKNEAYYRRRLARYKGVYTGGDFPEEFAHDPEQIKEFFQEHPEEANLFEGVYPETEAIAA